VTAATHGLGFAAAGAVGYGIASVLQAVGARHAAGTLRTVGHPAYLAGLGLDLLAWLASLVALRSLPVYQVQTVLAGSLAVTVVVARLTLRTRLRRIDLTAVAATTGALAVLAASAGPQPTPDTGTLVRWGLGLPAIPIAVAGWQTARARTAATTAVLAGLAFGGAALCSRAVVLPADPVHHPVFVLASIAADPLGWALAGYAVTGALLYAHALEHGQAAPVTALLWISEIVVPAPVGVLLLGDTVRTGWYPAVAVAAAVAVGAAAVLAWSPAHRQAAAPPVVGDSPRRCQAKVRGL
jgi:hypothetical protein